MAHTRTWQVGWFLTIRSLARGNIGTSVMTVCMMALIFVNLIFSTSLINGLTQTAHRQIIETLTSDVLVEPDPGEAYITPTAQVLHDLQQIPGVRAVSARLNFSAELTGNDEEGNYHGVAIDPVAEATTMTLADHIVAGRMLVPSDRDALLLGVQVAGGDNVELNAYSLKGVQVGDTVTVGYTGGLEKEYTVVGLVDHDFVQADNRFFITDQEYTSLFPQFRNHASELSLAIQSDVTPESIVAEIKDRGIAQTVRTWKDTAGIVKSFTASFDIVNFILSIVALVVAGITIFIVMYVDVVNRRRQIGILRAIGIAEASIAISYILRAVFYAICGIIVGMALFRFGIMPIFQNKPLQLPLGPVRPLIDQTIVYVRGLSLLLVSFLGAYIPVQRALRMRIIDAIWG